MKTPENPDETDRRKVTNHEEYFNNRFPQKPVFVPICGGRCSNKRDEMLVTTVGTGIAVCLNDREAGMGGLVHFFIPEIFSSDLEALQENQGKHLKGIIEMLFISGSKPEQIKAKLFGGGWLLETNDNNDGIQAHDFVKGILNSAGIKITIEEIGSNVGRRIHLFPRSGKVVRRLLQREVDRAVLLERENKFNKEFSS